MFALRKLFNIKTGIIILILFSLFLPLLHADAGLAESIATLATGGAIYAIVLVLLCLASVFSALTSQFLATVANPDFVNIGFTQLKYADGTNTFIGIGWELSRNLAETVIVVALIAIGLGVALRIFEAKKALITLIGVAIIIPFTPVICGLIIDAGNIITNTFLEAGAVSGLGQISNELANVGELLKGKISWEGMISFISGELLGELVMFTFVTFLNGLIIGLYGILFFVRYTALWILVILSPLAYGFYILPQTRHYFKKWWEQLISWSIVGVAGSFFIYLAAIANNAIMKDKNLMNFSGGLGGLILSSHILYFLVPITILIIGLIAATTGSAEGAKMIVNFAKKKGTGYAKQGAGFMSRRILASKGAQKAMGRLQNLRNVEKTSLEQKIGKKGKIGKGIAGASYWARRNVGMGTGFLATKGMEISTDYQNKDIMEQKSTFAKIYANNRGKLLAEEPMFESGKIARDLQLSEWGLYSKNNKDQQLRGALRIADKSPQELKGVVTKSPSLANEKEIQRHLAKGKKYDDAKATILGTHSATDQNSINKAGVFDLNNITKGENAFNSNLTARGFDSNQISEIKKQRQKLVDKAAEITKQEVVKSIKPKDIDDIPASAFEEEWFKKSMVSHMPANTIRNTMDKMGGDYGDKLMDIAGKNIEQVAKTNPQFLMHPYTPAGEIYYTKKMTHPNTGKEVKDKGEMRELITLARKGGTRLETIEKQTTEGKTPLQQKVDSAHKHNPGDPPNIKVKKMTPPETGSVRKTPKQAFEQTKKTSAKNAFRAKKMTSPKEE